METKTQPRRHLFWPILLIVLSIASLTISGLIIMKTFSKQSLPEDSSSLTPNTSEEKIPCGGFAGAICPDGYECQLEGDYPDAGGNCVKITNAFTCPSGEWVNCMPGPDAKPECSTEAMAWYKANCPNFKGGAL